MANTKSIVHPQKQYRCSWITVVGWSPQAVLNTLWCAREQGVVPDHLVLLHSQGDNRVCYLESAKRKPIPTARS